MHPCSLSTNGEVVSKGGQGILEKEVALPPESHALFPAAQAGAQCSQFQLTAGHRQMGQCKTQKPQVHFSQ